MVMNEKVGDFLRFCAAPASTVIYCKQDMLAVLLAVLLAAAHKSIWLFVATMLTGGRSTPARRAFLVLTPKLQWKGNWPDETFNGLTMSGC